MRSAFLLGRLCARRAHIPASLPLSPLLRGSSRSEFTRLYTRLHVTLRPRPQAKPKSKPNGIVNTWNITGNKGKTGGNPGFTQKVLSAAATGALGTAAFVQLSESDNGGTEQTAEGRMLEVSRDELKKEVDESERGLWRLGHQILFCVDLYLWEPLCTGIRFLHLVIIFVPVILAVPAIWVRHAVVVWLLSQGHGVGWSRVHQGKENLTGREAEKRATPTLKAPEPLIT